MTHVLTGAASGIGRAVAERLVARGDKVLALVRSEARLTQLAEELPGLEALQVADLASPADLRRLAAELASSYAEVESLLHVGGAVDLFPVAGLDLVQWQRQLDVNLTAPAILTQAFLPALRTGRGTVLFLNSGAGLFAHPTWSSYAASKFGVRAFADALRGEEAANGVRVTSVYAGRTATPMQEKVHEQEGRAYDAGDWIQPGTIADAILHVLDLPPDASITELTVKPR
jgi:NADP-dependent 3-hydroxy acid dehydrogenase YdfG